MQVCVYLLWIFRIHHNNDIKVGRNSTVHNVTIIRSSLCSMKCCGAGAASALLSPAIVSGGAGAGRAGKGERWPAAGWVLRGVTRDTWHWPRQMGGSVSWPVIASYYLLCHNPSLLRQSTPAEISTTNTTVTLWFSICGYPIISNLCSSRNV